MTGRRLPSLGVVPLAIAGVAALGGSPATTPALATGVKTVVAEAKLVDTESWIIGGSGIPIPPQSYLDNVSERFINPSSPLFDGQPVFPVDATNPLFTPEGLYPYSGIKVLPFDTSAAQGKEILDSTIAQQIADGNNLVVLGYSQSATISTLEMRDLLQSDNPPGADQLSFVLLGNPSNPDGGVLSRFDVPGLQTPTIPSLGITFSGATPADTPWDTAIYTLEYDGFGDFPKYPINFLADLNALVGILTVHGTYPTLTDAQMASAIPVPTSDDYAGDTTYWMIPYQDGHLPLTDLIAQIPVVGQPLADLLEPDLEVLVNLGYGPDPDIGWSTTGANLFTPFGVFPELTSEQFNTVLQALADGAQKGVTDFMADLSNPAAWLADPFTALDPSPAADLPSLTDIVNAFSGAFASAYAALLPTADIANALLTTLPAYAISLFLQELQAGDLLDAIGMPVAATVGLTTMAAGFELIAIEHGIAGISESLAPLFG